MKIERVRPSVFRVTVHAYELAALVASARAVAEGSAAQTSPEAAQQIRGVLRAYDEEIATLGPAGPDASTRGR